MQTTTRITIRFLLVVWLMSLAGSALAAVTLVENGRPRAEIILADSATVAEKLAADELLRYVKRTTGAALPVRARRTGGKPAVLIGTSAAPEPVRARVSRLARDGFIVEAGGDTVILAGHERAGTVFAVYELLERFAGVRWLWPGETGEVVPRRQRIIVSDTSTTKEPAFVWRDLGPGGALWGFHDRWTKERDLGISTAHQAAMRLWERRNRFGGLNIYGGHAFGDILPPAVHGPTHPEYYALVNGKRDWQNFNGKHRAQFCTSNPEVVQKTIEYCRTHFITYPELDGISISPNDGRGFCECDSCTRLDSGRVQREEGDPEMGRAAQTRIITDRMVTFGNQVAEGVAQTHPDKKILFYAYSQFHEPPERVRPRENLVMIYTINAAGFWNQAAREKAFQDFATWARVTPSFGVYEYHTQTNFPDMPRLIPDLIQLELKELQRLDARYFHSQAGNGFAVNGLNFYLLGKLLWDPAADVKAIVADYVTTGFGPAAPAMARYFDRFIASWRSQKSVPVKMNSASLSDYEAVLGAYPGELREAGRRDLEEALRLATGGHKRRVEFVRHGFRYFTMTIEAAKATYPLLQSGWKPGGAAPADGRISAAQIERALDLWRERERYIERHREDFVLSYLWVKSGDETRSFNPLRRVRSAGGQTTR